MICFVAYLMDYGRIDWYVGPILMVNIYRFSCLKHFLFLFFFLAFLSQQEIRRAERHKTGILDMIQGSQYLVWYFRALGASIGHNVCLYPNGGTYMKPFLITFSLLDSFPMRA